MLLRFQTPAPPPTSRPRPRVLLPPSAAPEQRRPQASSKPATPSTSISQVHSYGTVDYERRPALSWSAFYRKIIAADLDGERLGVVIAQWEAEQPRPLLKGELCRAAKELRKFRRPLLALEIYEWMLKQGTRFTLTTGDMAVMLDLIAIVHGVQEVEKVFSKLPDDLIGKQTYGALLHTYSRSKMKDKAEAVFNKMLTDGHVTDPLPFNVMMTLYMDVNEHNMVLKMIDEMKARDIPLDNYSYNIWITSCAAVGDVEEMERVANGMVSDPDVSVSWQTCTTLATMYIRLGDYDKAWQCLKDAEVRVTGRDRKPFHFLIGLFSCIGKKEDVYHVWNWYKATFPVTHNLGYLSMLSALIKLHDTNGLELVFNEWLSVTTRYDPKLCNLVIGWYTRQGLREKARELFNAWTKKGGRPRSSTWQIIAEGYLEEQRVSDTLQCMMNAVACAGSTKWAPKILNSLKLLEVCKKTGDVASVEMLLEMLRSRGCDERENYGQVIQALEDAVAGWSKVEAAAPI